MKAKKKLMLKSILKRKKTKIKKHRFLGTLTDIYDL